MGIVLLTFDGQMSQFVMQTQAKNDASSLVAMK